MNQPQDRSLPDRTPMERPKKTPPIEIPGKAPRHPVTEKPRTLEAPRKEPGELIPMK